MPLTSCRNSNGSLVGSFAPSSYGLTTGAFHLQVVVQRTNGGATESSGIQRSSFVLVDNIAPELASAMLGCLSNLVASCHESRAVTLHLTKPVRGDFHAADFTVSSNAVLSATSECTPSTWCDEVALTLVSASAAGTSPSVSYAYSDIVGRTRPRDALGTAVGSRTVASESLLVDYELDSETDFFADDLAEPATDAVSSAPGSIVVLDDNMLQIYADGWAGHTCPDALGADADEGEKQCEPAKREIRLAKRIAALSVQTTEDGIGAAPDILLIQEARREDAAALVGHLNRLINLDGTRCNVELLRDRCYGLRVSTNQEKGIVKSGDGYRVVSDTAIIWNKRTMVKAGEPAAFWTTYTKAQACKPQRDAVTAEVIFIDVDLDNFNDCLPKKRQYKQHWMAGFTEKPVPATDPGTGLPLPPQPGLSIVASSIHWTTPSHLDKDSREAVPTAWAAKSAQKLAEFSARIFTGGATMQVMGGDFNARRCKLDTAPEPADCDARGWWNTLTGDPLRSAGNGFHDAVLAANSTDDQDIAEQYRNGTRPPEQGKRIDYIFSKAASGNAAVKASTNYRCGLTDTRGDQAKTCAFLSNIERYSDHRLLWSEVRG